MCQVSSLTSIESTVLLQNGSAADSKHFLTASVERDMTEGSSYHAAMLFSMSLFHSKMLPLLNLIILNIYDILILFIIIYQ